MLYALHEQITNYALAPFYVVCRKHAGRKLTGYTEGGKLPTCSIKTEQSKNNATQKNLKRLCVAYIFLKWSFMLHIRRKVANV